LKFALKADTLKEISKILCLQNLNGHSVYQFFERSFSDANTDHVRGQGLFRQDCAPNVVGLFGTKLQLMMRRGEWGRRLRRAILLKLRRHRAKSIATTVAAVALKITTSS